jgi:cation:H+ antiporter
MEHALEMILGTGTAVVIAGILLGWSADRIANATGLGELWTGWVLLAGATSVPEFVTDTSAIRIHAANLAGGDLFGSSLTNMAILAVLALLFPPGNEKGRTANNSRGAATQDSPDLFNAGLAILLTVVGTVFTLFHSNIGIPGIRPESLSLLVLWIVGTRILYKRQRPECDVLGAEAGLARENLIDRITRASWPIVIFATGASIILLVAPIFARSAQQFAAVSGWGDSFVGTWLVGFSTALPDLVSSVTACRLGAFDLAVASLYGSCAFNMVVFFVMDLVSTRPVFSLLEPVLALSGSLAVVLMLLGVAVVTLRQHLVLAPTLRGCVLLGSYGVAILIIYACR